jgi:hypothetical protein
VYETVHGVTEARDSVNAGQLKRACHIVVFFNWAVHVRPFFHPQNYPPEEFLPVFCLGGSYFCSQLGSIPYCGGISVEIFPSK